MKLTKYIKCLDCDFKGDKDNFIIPAGGDFYCPRCFSTQCFIIHESKEELPKIARIVENMECKECGFVGDDVQDFLSTKISGERFCPKCNSSQCFII